MPSVPAESTRHATDGAIKNLFVMNRTPTWLASVLWRLGTSAMMAILFVLIGASTAAFLAFSVSLTNTSSVFDLIGAIVAAVTFVVACRAFFGYDDPTLFTVAFVLLFSLVALGFGFICRGESIRVTLWVLGALGLLGDGCYCVRYIRARRRDSLASKAEQKNGSYT